ncbi:hypothetical protein TanjilG_09884 [Lupinus angustifolius]|uniref:Uncharacterized protein n=1 Tax=Lupinus angustifolius TaxID=3871 RepID=A0A1J7H798_LUPAN|nr:hypothetical protein TanjilG_09884 [Lupinus angustifolius]
MEARAILEDDIDVDNCVELVMIEDTIEVEGLTSDSDDKIVAPIGAGAVVVANKDDTKEDPKEGSSTPSS